MTELLKLYNKVDNYLQVNVRKHKDDNYFGLSVKATLEKDVFKSYVQNVSISVIITNDRNIIKCCLGVLHINKQLAFKALKDDLKLYQKGAKLDASKRLIKL